MIKVYLDNGEIIECKECLSEIVSWALQTGKEKANLMLALVKTDDTGALFNWDKILRIEGQMSEEPDSEVETGPYSEDIVVE